MRSALRIARQNRWIFFVGSMIFFLRAFCLAKYESNGDFLVANRARTRRSTPRSASI